MFSEIRLERLVHPQSPSLLHCAERYEPLDAEGNGRISKFVRRRSSGFCSAYLSSKYSGCPLWCASSALTGTRFAALTARGETMAVSHTWNLFARENDLSNSQRLSGTLSLDCPAWTSWRIQLPCPASIEVMVTTGTLQVSAAGKTQRVTAGQRIALPTAQRIFVYSTGDQDAASLSSTVHLEKHAS